MLAAIGDAEYELRRSSDLFKTTNDPNSDDLLNPYNLDTETSSAAIRFSNQSKDFRADEVNAIYAQLYRARRVSVIAELFKEAGKPTVKRGIGYAKGLLAFFRSPSVGGLRGLFGSIKAGVKKVATENRFGGAYIDMVRRFVDLTFKDMTAGSPKPIDKKHWQYWDSILTKACGWLASETDSKRDCTPGDYKP